MSLLETVSIVDSPWIQRRINGMKADGDSLYRLIGTRLKECRGKSNLTQEQLASRVGFERTSITNIEKGRQRLSLHALYEICFVLQIEVGSILPPWNEVMARDQGALVDGFKGDKESAPAEATDLINHLRNRASEGKSR